MRQPQERGGLDPPRRKPTKGEPMTRSAASARKSASTRRLTARRAGTPAPPESSRGIAVGTARVQRAGHGQISRPESRPFAGLLGPTLDRPKAKLALLDSLLRVSGSQ